MLSYARGPDAPLAEYSIDEQFSTTVERCADRDALIVPFQNLRFTYSQLAKEVDAVARGLRGLGLEQGDRFGVWASNCAEWVMLQLASARAGVVLVNVNPAYRAHELEYVLRRSRMRVLFLHDRDEHSDYRAILDDAVAVGGFALPKTIYLGTAAWEEMVEGGRDLGPRRPAGSDVANMQYTSGTTGSPKGVLLTHRNILNNGRFIAMWLRMTEQDRICAPVPMYHCFGCVIGTMAAISSGAALILPAPRFHATETMTAIERERATLVYGVPTMFIAQLNHPDFVARDFSSLRGGVMAGAPCPVEVMKQVMRDMHCAEITIVYGQTEASPVITGSAVDDSVELRVGTVGRAFPNTEVKICTENGETVPVGQQGELCARGYLIMQGYDGDAAATSAAIDAEGWLHTGDLAIMREDGYINLTGRARDVIIRGGENVYPREVEEFLHTHPKVAAVEVVGLPDRLLGEAVAAWVKLRSGHTMAEEDVREFCRGQIAHYKIPQFVRFVDSFPMTVTGKTQKYLIRQREIELRGLDEVAHIQTA